MEGACLCGAVTVRVEPGDRILSACHCSMCRRWTGSVQYGFAVPPEDTTISGPVKSYASSAFSTRAWCDTCGSALWLRDGEGDYEFVPGLFPETGDWPLDHENYVDRAPVSMRLAGDHRRITAAEYEATSPHVEGDLA